MPTWGDGTRWGTPRKWGYGGMPAAVQAQRDIVGGAAPWMGAHTIPWRDACVAVWTVDIATWELDTALPGIGVGGQRAATFENGRYQQETLTLTLNQPADYLPGGGHVGLIALGTLLRVVWTITSPAGSLTVQSPVYTIQSVPSRDDDVLGGSPLTLTAVDYLTWLRGIEAFPSGYASYGAFNAQVDFALANGMPAVAGLPTTYATLIAAQVFDFVGGLLHIAPSWQPTREAPIGGDDPLFLQGIPFLVAQPGTAATFGDVLDYFWNYEPFALTWDYTGTPTIRGALSRKDSGLVLSRDPAVGGVLAVPWETLARNIAAPAFTALTYNVVPTTTPAEGVSGAPSTFTQGGLAVSQSSVNPHRPGTTTHRVINDRTPGASTGGFSTLNAYARYLLAQELGKSDTLTITLDSACVPIELGTELRVSDAVKGIDGVWQLVQIGQPLDLGPATLTAQWVQDA